jgi:crossover junction endodeoxyribonuclease RusA
VGSGIGLGGMLKLTLPYPPTVNTYYRKWNNRMVISPSGKNFRNMVWMIAKRDYPKHKTFTEPVSIKILVHPPDKRKRDLDNILKGLLDSLAKAGIFADDSQVEILHLIRLENVVDGCVVVFVSEVSDEDK